MNRRSFLKTAAAGIAALAGIGTKATIAKPLAQPLSAPPMHIKWLAARDENTRLTHLLDMAVGPHPVGQHCRCVVVPPVSTIGPFDWCDFPSFELWQEALIAQTRGRLEKSYTAQFVSDVDSGPIKVEGFGTRANGWICLEGIGEKPRPHGGTYRITT
jgi:hypothetical protein